MNGAKKSTWIGGTVFVGLLIVVAAWFLAISPTMSAAAETRTQAQEVRLQNELLEDQVAQLRIDFEKLPEYQAQLAALQTQIPVEAKLADYLRQLDQIAVAHSVTLTAITPSPAQLVVPAVPTAPVAAPAAAPAPGATPAPTDAATPSPSAAPADVTAVPAGAPAMAPPGFAAIPFSITVVGSYDNTVAFLNSLQNVTTRLFLVTALTGKSQVETEAGGGRPATVPGDQELVITGFTYVLPDSLGVPAPVDPAAVPPALPGAVPGKNPLVPVAGR